MCRHPRRRFAVAKVQLFSESTKFAKQILHFCIKISPIRQIGQIGHRMPEAGRRVDRREAELQDGRIIQRDWKDGEIRTIKTLRSLRTITSLTLYGLVD